MNLTRKQSAQNLFAYSGINTREAFVGVNFEDDGFNWEFFDNRNWSDRDRVIFEVIRFLVTGTSKLQLQDLQLINTFDLLAVTDALKIGLGQINPLKE
jgi:hypothetical protein